VVHWASHASVQPEVQLAVHSTVQLAVQPSVHVVMQPVVHSAVHPSVQAAVQPVVQAAVHPSVQLDPQSDISAPPGDGKGTLPPQPFCRAQEWPGTQSQPVGGGAGGWIYSRKRAVELGQRRRVAAARASHPCAAGVATCPISLTRAFGKLPPRAPVPHTERIVRNTAPMSRLRMPFCPVPPLRGWSFAACPPMPETTALP
jgi:hypothetical protein